MADRNPAREFALLRVPVPTLVNLLISSPGHTMGSLGHVSYNALGKPFFVLLFASLSYATSIIVIRTPDHVIVAADSVYRTGYGQEMGCKIMHEGAVYFANAGIVENDHTGFKVSQIAQVAIQLGSDDVNSSARLFSSMTIVPFTRALEELRLRHPDFYARYATRGPQPLQVVFMRGSLAPAFVVIYFTIESSAGVPVKVKSHSVECPGIGCPDGYGVRLLGDNGAAQRASKAAGFWGAGEIEGARKLVEAEIVDAPDDVRPPIDVLRLERQGSALDLPEGTMQGSQVIVQRTIITPVPTVWSRTGTSATAPGQDCASSTRRLKSGNHPANVGSAGTLRLDPGSV